MAIPPRATFAILVCSMIAIGVFFRFYQLDRKVVWSDEIFTELHVAGVTEAELVNSAGRFLDVASLRAYVTAASARRSDRSRATIDALVEEDPQHTPLFYVVELVWIRNFGNTLAAERALPAAIGVLVLPCAYWLAIELFGSAGCAWTFAGLIAISPYFVLYSQENREYALWALALVVLSASLLRAVRLMTRSSWAVYTASLIFAIYTDALSLAVVAGHMAYLAIAERRRLALAPWYVTASYVAGLATFLPWLMVLIERRGQVAQGLASTVSGKNSPASTLRTFFGEWHLAIIDFNSVSHSQTGLIASIAALATICVAALIFVRNAASRTKMFVLCSAVAPLVPILVADILIGGHRSSNPRYLVPLYECIEIVLAFALARAVARNVRWEFGIAAVAVAGIFSCSASSAADTWWSKYNERSIALAAVIDRAPRPIVVSDNYIHFVLSLAPYLRPDTRIVLEPRCFLCRDAKRLRDSSRLNARIGTEGDVFLLGPSPALVKAIRVHRSHLDSRVRCIDVDRNCSSDMRLF